MKFSIYLILFLYCQVTFGQTFNQRVFSQKMKLPESGEMGVQVLRMGESFLGTPYVAGTLEGNAVERLVCRFDGLDCTTLVETSISLALAKQLNENYDGFRTQLTNIRYRDGEINGYPSRLHYVLDWLYENGKRGLLEDITEKIGGVPFNKEINFMSNHANLYAALKSSSVWETIKEQEQAINQRTHFYIPEQEIQRAEPLLRDGDIVAFTSSVSGLDCNHMGIISKIGNRAYLLHASLQLKKVVMSEIPLAEYVGSIPKHTGIIVARLKELE